MAEEEEGLSETKHENRAAVKDAYRKGALRLDGFYCRFDLTQKVICTGK